MKKIALLGLVSIFILTSCAGSKTVVDSEKTMRGDWTISNVTVQGIDENLVNVKVLDEADSKCYEGSTWHLIQNNNSGNYSLNGAGDCPMASSNIKWFVSEENGQVYFNFKRVYDGVKAKNVIAGYKLRVVSLNEQNMVLTQDLLFDGKPLNVVYAFTKTNK